MQEERKTPLTSHQMEIEDIVSPIHTPDSLIVETNNPNISIIAEEKMLYEDDDLNILDDIQKERKESKQIKRPVHINEEALKVIKNMNLRGYTAKEISLITEVTKSTVYKYIDRLNDNKMKENDDVKQLIKTRGRKKSTNFPLQSKLKDFMDGPQQMTLRQMRETLKEEDGVEISLSYLSKTIKQMGKSKRNSVFSVSKSNQNFGSSVVDTATSINANDNLQDDLPPATYTAL